MRDRSRRVTPGTVIYAAIIARLERYAWPGNVRELRNGIESMVLMSDHPVLGVEDLPLDFISEVTGDEAGASAAFRLSESEADLIRRAIAATHGNLTRAARELDIAKSTLYQKIKQYDLAQEIYRARGIESALIS